MTPERFKRATAYKLRIGEILSGKPVKNDERFNFLELGDKEIRRVNVVANIIEKYENPGGENKTKYSSFTIDDASGQIKLKAFGDDVDNFSNIEQGDTVMIVGKLREYNDEVYILPEIIKKKDPRYLLVRKLELQGEEKKVDKTEVKAVKDKIIEMTKEAEKDGGIDTDKIVMELDSQPEIINQEIKKLLEEGLAYEPRPGKVRYLG
jgi:RPA family protein